MKISTIVSARAYSGHSSELNELMSFGHVVHSDGEGTVSEGRLVYGPEAVYLRLQGDGQSLDDDFQDVPKGWEPLTGFTGQHGYGGSVMHQSEYIGGGLERHIRENAGYYVAAVVDGMYDEDPPEWETEESPNVGWAIFYREL